MVELKSLVLLRNSLCKCFVGRDEAVDAVLAGLVSGEPTILIGPPGTAKTKLVEVMASAINARYFYYLLTKFTEPDELLGPLDINALREGRYVRITKGRLPDAEIVFLDEVFKASSAIRNILLDIMLNKRYFNGGHYVELPIIALYSASNEVSYDVEDAAFYDRFVIRCFVDYVPPMMVADLLKYGVKLEMSRGFTKQVISKDDILTIRGTEVMKRFNDVVNNGAIIKKYVDVLGRLKNRGIVLSDRRKVKALKVAAAISVMMLSSRVTLDDIADALIFVAPNDEDEVVKVKEVIVEEKLSEIWEDMKKLETLKTELEHAIRSLAEASKKDEGILMEVKKVQVLVQKAKILLERYKRTQNLRIMRVVKEFRNVVREATEMLNRVLAEIAVSDDVEGIFINDTT